MKFKLAVFTTLFAGAVFATERPNVIFLLCDDLGYGDVGYTFQNARAATGAIAIRTPVIDSLATNGTILTDHYCAAPVCAPSRASILTGKLTMDCSLKHNAFDKPITETTTLASVMKAAGYETYAVGKWGIGGGGESGYPVLAHPLDRGFDHYYGFMDHRAGHTYYHWDGNWGRAYMGVWEDREKATGTAVGRYSTDVFIARAKKYIESQLADVAHRENPFFMYLAINTIHGSGRNDASLKTTTSLHVPGGAYVKSTDDHGKVIWPIPEEPREKRNTYINPEYRTLEDPMARRYATGITRFDEALGDLVEFLKEKGIYENTIIIFTSDNGPAAEYGAHPNKFGSNGPFSGYKRDVFEGGMRVPTFISWPGNEAAAKKVISEPSISADWLGALKKLVANPKTVPVPVSTRIETRYDSPTGSSLERVKGGHAGGSQWMKREGDIVTLHAGGLDTPEQRYNVRTDPHQDHDLNLVHGQTVDRDEKLR